MPQKLEIVLSHSFHFDSSSRSNVSWMKRKIVTNDSTVSFRERFVGKGTNKLINSNFKDEKSIFEIQSQFLSESNSHKQKLQNKRANHLVSGGNAWTETHHAQTDWTKRNARNDIEFQPLICTFFSNKLFFYRMQLKNYGQKSFYFILQAHCNSIRKIGWHIWLNLKWDILV